MKVVKITLCVASAVMLAACGGGGSSGGGAIGSLGAMTATGEKPTTSDAAVQKLDASWTKVANEGGSLNMASATVVQYGAGDSYVQKTVTGSGTCSNAFFGGDPAYGVVKACYTQSGTASTTTPTTTDVYLAAEGAGFTVATGSSVKYGAGSVWIAKPVSGSGSCTNAFFGTDPVPNVVKACYLVAATR